MDLAKFQSKVIRVIYWMTLPILFFLVSVTIWFYSSKNEGIVLFFVIGGILIGVLLNILFLKKTFNKLYDLPVPILATIYLFYSICIYGFFMGFPGFNLLAGILAAFYFAQKHDQARKEHQRSDFSIKRISFFTSIVMFLFCALSMIFVPTESGIEKEIQNMFHIGFAMARNLTISLIALGGLCLTVFQYYLTQLTYVLMIKYTASGDHQTL